MKDREAFLARWSRRKREAAADRPEPVSEPPAAPVAASEKSELPSATPVPGSQPEPAAELPPIDSIDSGTDIRAFLAQGVPQELARAALRRAWNSDPAIRDFIGLSENAWDFTAPEGVPGFGPFAPDAARQLVARVLGEVEPAAGTKSPSPEDAESGRALPRGSDAEHGVVNIPQRGEAEAERAGGVGASVERGSDQEPAAMQQQATGPEPAPRSSDEDHPNELLTGGKSPRRLPGT